MNIDRLQKEQSFHDERFKGDADIRDGVAKYYSINEGTRQRYLDIISAHSDGKKLLEYGCGTGESSIQFMEKGAQLTGIDISPEGIRKAIEFVSKTKHAAEYYVMDAERTTFSDRSFELIVGAGIIHHLDISKAYKELNRLLVNEGHAVFIEPLGHNPLINLYRKFTPELRTEDEHPLTTADLKSLEQYFENVDTEYYSLFTLLAVPFRNRSFFIPLCRMLDFVDRTAFKIPFVKKYAWTVIIHARNPKVSISL